MMAYENDTLIIPEKYKKMSVSELEKEKARLLQEINGLERTRKVIRENKKRIAFFI